MNTLSSNDDQDQPEAKRKKQEESTNASKEVRVKKREHPSSFCTVCNKTMIANNLRRHMKTSHFMDPKVNGVCVDRERGIYLVRCTEKRSGYPVHVQKCIQGTNEQLIYCEVKECQAIGAGIGYGGFKSYECQHLLSASLADHVEFTELVDDKLKELSSAGNYKILTDKRIEEIKDFNTKALHENAVPVVRMPAVGGTINQFYSVYTDKVEYYSRLKRCVLTYNTADCSLDCACCTRKCPCVHKAMVIWSMCCEGIEPNIALESSENSTQIIQKDVNDCHLRAPNDTYIYPPKDNNSIIAMTKYLKQWKSIPWPLPSSVIEKGRSSDLPKSFVPRESHCAFCEHQPLSDPLLVTRHGKLLTFDHIVNDIDIYIKICTKCDTPYRYQEFHEGFHNFDDMLFLSYDMLNILHESVAKHIAIGSLAEVFGHRYESKINPNKIVHTYQHFDALCDKAYNFNCVICGYHPKILTVDVNRKTVFVLDLSSIESTANKEDLSDFVNAREFWENVEHHIIASPLGISEKVIHSLLHLDIAIGLPIWEKKREKTICF